MTLLVLPPARDGLAPLGPLDPAILERGTPQMLGRTHVADADARYKCVVWGATPYRIHPKQRPDHEFGYILEGGFTLTDGAGTDTTVAAGDAYVLPARFTYQWGQAEPVLKTAVSVVLPEAAGDDGFVVFRRAALAADGSRSLYRDPSGRLEVSLAVLAPGDTLSLPAGSHVLLIVLAGKPEVEQGDDRRAAEPGDRLHLSAGPQPGRIAARDGARILVCTTALS